MISNVTTRCNKELVFDFATTLKAIAVLDSVGAIIHLGVKAIIPVVGTKRYSLVNWFWIMPWIALTLRETVKECKIVYCMYL